MHNNRYSFHLLLHSAHLLEDRLRQRLEQHGVHPRQARILDALSRLGQASQAEIASQFAVTPASMSTMTARLLAAGLIERRVNEAERRSNLLSLTERGQALLSVIYEEWASMDRELEATLGAYEATALADLTRRLRDALGGFAPGELAER